MDIRASVKVLIIRLSRFAAARRILCLVQGWCLTLFVVLAKRDARIEGIVLRRARSLTDAYPGDSDFDIACVVASGVSPTALPALADKLRALKRLIPVIGEITLVEVKDFVRHLRYCFPLYQTSGDLKILFARPDFRPTTPRDVPSSSIALRIVALVRDRLIPYVYWDGEDFSASGGRSFSRGMLKNLKKMVWLAGLTQSREVGELDYSDINRDGLDRTPLERLRGFKRGVHDASEEFKHRPPSPAEIRISGPIDPFPQAAIQRIEKILAPLMRGFKARFAKIALQPFRLYMFDASLVMKESSSLRWGENPAFLAEMRRVARAIQDERLFFHPNGVMPLDREAWELVSRLDPIFGILDTVGGHDFLREEPGNPKPRDVTIDMEAVYSELSWAISALGSELIDRSGYYILDILFGRLVAYNRLIRERILYTSFNALFQSYLCGLGLSPAQTRLLELYSQRDRAEIGKMRGEDIWSDLLPIILREVGCARRTLAQRMSPPDNAAQSRGDGSCAVGP